MPLECALLVFCVAATIDAARKPRSAFEQAGKRRWFWVLAPIAGSGCYLILSIVFAIMWFMSVKASVMASMPLDEPRPG